VVRSSSLFWLLLETETVATSLIWYSVQKGQWPVGDSDLRGRFTRSPEKMWDIHPQPVDASLLYRIFMRPRQWLAGLVSGAVRSNYSPCTPHRPR
jgi:hypothetical protein